MCTLTCAHLLWQIELNFFYAHYLRVEHFPVVYAEAARIGFGYIQECKGLQGIRTCRKYLDPRQHDFMCFNDDASDDSDLKMASQNLHYLLTHI